MENRSFILPPCGEGGPAGVGRGSIPANSITRMDPHPYPSPQGGGRAILTMLAELACLAVFVAAIFIWSAVIGGGA